MSELTHEIARQEHAERIKHSRQRPEQGLTSGPREVVLRLATREDAGALELLAALEGLPLASGQWLYAEADGAPAVALHLADGALLTNPFARTLELRHVLELWARELTGQRRRRLFAF
jgi:hypothetical protein